MFARKLTKDFSDIEITACITDYEVAEHGVIVPDSVLYKKAEEYVRSSGTRGLSLNLAMYMIAMECFRYIAMKHLRSEE